MKFNDYRNELSNIHPLLRVTYVEQNSEKLEGYESYELDQIATLLLNASSDEMSKDYPYIPESKMTQLTWTKGLLNE